MPKITVKNNLIVFHDPGDWSAIYSRILTDFGMGMTVRTRMRRELGFVYRYHQGLAPVGDSDKMYYEDQVHLDFYSDQAQTWFSLKYL
jgi:glutamine synthetase adenylyltransferase